MLHKSGSRHEVFEQKGFWRFYMKMIHVPRVKTLGKKDIMTLALHSLHPCQGSRLMPDAGVSFQLRWESNHVVNKHYVIVVCVWPCMVTVSTTPTNELLLAAFKTEDAALLWTHQKGINRFRSGRTAGQGLDSFLYFLTKSATLQHNQMYFRINVIVEWLLAVAYFNDWLSLLTVIISLIISIRYRFFQTSWTCLILIGYHWLTVFCSLHTARNPSGVIIAIMIIHYTTLYHILLLKLSLSSFSVSLCLPPRVLGPKSQN